MKPDCRESRARPARPARGTSRDRPASSTCQMEPRCRETVKTATAPDYFAYRLTEFSSRMISMLVREANGQWWFTDEGAGTQAKWTYTAEGRIDSRDANPLSGDQDPLASLHELGDEEHQGTGGERSHEGLTMKKWDFDLVALHGAQEMTAEDRAYRGSRYADVRKALYANPVSGRHERPGAGTAADVQVDDPQRVARPALRREQVPAGVRSSHRFEGRSPLGRGRQGLAADHRAERHLRARHLGDHRGQPVHRLLREGIEGADDRPVLVGRQRNEARAAAVDQPRHEDLSDDGSRASDAADPGERDRAGRSRRHAHRLHERCRAGQRAERPCLPPRHLLPRSCCAPARSFSGSTRSATAVSCTKSPSSASLRTSVTNAPEHMLLKMAPGQRRIEGRHLDFRDEIYSHIFKPGDAAADGRHGVRHLGVELRAQDAASRDCRAWRSPTGSASAHCDSPKRSLPTTPTTSSSSIIPAGATTATIRPPTFASTKYACGAEPRRSTEPSACPHPSTSSSSAAALAERSRRAASRRRACACSSWSAAADGSPLSTRGSRLTPGSSARTSRPVTTAGSTCASSGA